MNLTLLKDNSIIICPFSIKKSLIEKISKENPLLHVKFISKNELLEGAYFSYDYKALNYVKRTYNYSYENSEEILNNLMGIKNYNDKLDELKMIYDDLCSKKLLKSNHLFKKLFLNKNVYVYGYSSKDIELSEALNIIGISCVYLENNTDNGYRHTVYKFNEIEKEVSYVFNEISKLIEKGVSLNNIYLYKVPSDYNLIVKKYMNYYALPIELDEDIYLYDSPLYKKFVAYLSELEIEKAYEKTLNENPVDSLGALNKLARNIVDINELKLDKEEFVELLNYVSKKTKLKNITYKESIKICDCDSVVKNDDYVFMLGFSLGSYPVISRDVDFFMDEEKEVLKKNTSTIKNEIAKDKLVNFINNTKNLIITFKEKIGKSVFYPSLLIEELNIELKEGVVNSGRYSSAASKLEVARYKDDLDNYAIDNEYINTFNDEELNYKKYDYHYKDIPNYNYDDKIVLSATQIERYNRCNFRYFIEKVLNVKEYEDTFYAKLGTLYHLVLEHSLSKEIDLNDYKGYIEKEFPTFKERFFVNRLLPQVLEVIKKNKDFDEHSFFSTREDKEKEVSFEIDKNTFLYGKIDKMIRDTGSKDIAIIDYKTSDFKFDEKKVPYGLGMQLPIYSVLLKHEYSDYDIAGMYIQNVLINPFTQKEDDKPYYLSGISVADGDVLKRLDYSLNRKDEDGKPIPNSEFILGIRLKKDGTPYSVGPFISKENMEKMIEDTKKQILEINNNIRTGKYDIEPVVYDKEKNPPCKHCGYKDICFMKKADIKVVGKVEEDE